MLYPQQKIGTIPVQVHEWMKSHKWKDERPEDILIVQTMAGDITATGLYTKVQHSKCAYDGDLGVELAAEREDREAKKAEKDGGVGNLDEELRRKQKTIPILAKWYNDLMPATSSGKVQISAAEFDVDPDTRAKSKDGEHGAVSTGTSRRSRSPSSCTGPGATYLLALGIHALLPRLAGVREALRINARATQAHPIPDFIPDRLPEGYMGFISFRIFCTPGQPRDTPETILETRIGARLARLPLPCGILLKKECVHAVEELSPFDSQLYKAAQATTDAKLLPVVRHFERRADSALHPESQVIEGDDDEYVKRPRPHIESKTHLAYALVLLPQAPPAPLNKRRRADELEDDERPCKVAKVE
ncbi:hypothetical protein FB451DRAFT_1194750 [Mycena latifolia]|nr:hypothetical protein FB451DRAFT_1194750 [Mycena latifolia]